VIQVAATARVSEKADIEDSVRGTRIIIGEHAVVDAFVKIKPVGGTADVIIGERTYINSGTVIYSGNGVQIGCDVLIAANCTLAPVNHEYRSRSRTIREQGFTPSKGGIVIEDDVWLGAGCVVLDGARLRRGTVFAANSVVRGDTEPFSVYAGNPIVKIGERK
jgi:acetyltransferase-like isoleucine patch superfamily enzyme